MTEEDRRIRVGVGHPSGDPGRYRAFEVRAAYRESVGGWVAQVREENLNEQLEGRGTDPAFGGQPRAFPTPAACLGDAVAGLVARVECDQESDTA